MAKQEHKTENCTIVNGVVLTKGVFEFIEEMQLDDNWLLKETREQLSNTMSLLIMAKDYFTECDDIIEEIELEVQNINLLSRSFKKLMKP